MTLTECLQLQQLVLLSWVMVLVLVLSIPGVKQPSVIPVVDGYGVVMPVQAMNQRLNGGLVQMT